jgi:hypothetical protein
MAFNFNDNYGAKQDWEEVKKLIPIISNDIDLFYGSKRNRAAGRRARTAIIKLRKLLKDVRLKMAMQTNDYKSEY